ncbi:MAG: tRNA lysidine(34) synthetase TilS [Gammaproteobacteria bacterium]
MQTAAPIDCVRAALARHPAPRRYLLALSGGRDSVTLLHLMLLLRPQLPAPLSALHVDHGLQPQSAQWARSCDALCAQAGVPIRILAPADRPPPGASPENWARNARYRAIQAAMIPDDAVLTAHHADDQAETVLLRLLRGAGPHGLRAMAECRPLPPGVLMRPLLGCDGAAIEACARAAGLHWIEDPSNRDTRMDRNYLRLRVLPALRERWPGLAASLADGAAWQAEAADSIDAQARADLAPLRSGPDALDVPGLLHLEPVRRAAALRAWIREFTGTSPARRFIEQVQSEVLGARRDAAPIAHAPDVELRRHRDRLHRLAPPVACNDGQWVWSPPEPLPIAGGVLFAEPGIGKGLRRLAPGEAPYIVRLRRGGERGRLPGRAHRSDLKKLFQAAGVPPWERARTPLIVQADRLAAVPGLWVFEPFAARGSDPGWVPIWRPGAAA